MFNRLKAMFGRSERKSLEIPDLLLAGLGAPTASGVTISSENSLRCAAVYGCIKILAETFASLPVTLYRKTVDGGREKATDHPLFTLLADCPNSWTPASEWRAQMSADLALYGNAFSFVNRVGEKIVELIWLPRQFVLVRPDPSTWEPTYQVTNLGGELQEYGRDQILHIRNFAISALPHVGVSPIAEGREAIALSLVLEQYAAGLFGRGARPAGVLEYPGALNDDLMTRLRKSFSSIYGGGENSGRTAILENGVKFTPLQLTSTDAQFLEMRKFQLQEISRTFRIPLHMLGDLEKTTHSNAEELGQQFLSGTILPLVTLWEDSIKLSCLTPEERGDYIVSFDVDNLTRADIAARFGAYAQAISAGVLNPNEARAKENLAPYATGSTFMRPVNQAVAPTTGATNV